MEEPFEWQKAGVTYTDHMRWCKARALEELEFSGPAGALASMASDLGKHSETVSLAPLCALGVAHADNPTAMRRFIEGFADG